MGTLKFCCIVGSEPPIVVRIWSRRAPMQPHKANFSHYQGKAPGFTMTWQCRVSGLSVPQPKLVVAWFNSCAVVSDCCTTCFGLSTRNTLSGEGPTAPADSKTQNEVIPRIPCQTFPQDNELETKMIRFDTPNLSTSELLAPSTVGHRGSLKGWTHHQRKGADISNFSSITVINETSLT